MAGIEIKISDQIATLTFNRPEALNALNSEVLSLLSQHLSDLSHQEDVSIVVLTGAGDRSFIAGADIKEMQKLSPLEARKFSEKGQQTLFQLEKMPQITMAAVNGFALGGGCEMAMACDLVYASEKALFGQPEVDLGIIPGFGGTQRLARLIGPMKAREMILTGMKISAAEAVSLGLAAKAFPPDKLMEEVQRIAKTILAKGPQAIQRAKIALREGMDLDLSRACLIERDEFSLCFASPQSKEGMLAFMEKRKPNWKN